MRILLIHNFYKSTHIGGEDLVFRREVELLRGALGDDRVLTYSVENDRASLPGIVFNLFCPILHVMRIRRMVARNRIDLVHIHNDFPSLTLWVLRALRGIRCVRVQTLHNYRHWCMGGILYRAGKGICEDCFSSRSDLPGVLHGCYRKSQLQSLLVFIARRIYRWFALLKEVDAFFCLSPHQRNLLVRLGVHPGRIHLKPNTTAHGIMPPLSAIKNVDFLFIGRLEESKGLFKVLDALDANLQRRVQVVGHSDELDTLRVRYPDVTFHGKLPPDEVSELLARSRYLLHPSLCYETFGLTILEAMSLGVPVIGFAIGTRPDFIQEAVNGFFIHEGSIAADLNRALSFADEKSLSAAALRTAAEFRAEIIAERQIALYRKLLDDRKNSFPS